MSKGPSKRNSNSAKGGGGASTNRPERQERRKTPRGSKARPRKPTQVEAEIPKTHKTPSAEGLCHFCSRDLKSEERALFVEEEVGRVFCSEDCITQFFGPDIERLEKDYLRHRNKRDLNDTDREKFSHLRWVTLQEPDEVWCEKTLMGDLRYTLISEFCPSSKPVWCVCICLFLRGEPSFLYLAFPTKNAAMVNHYRKGERVEVPKVSQANAVGSLATQAPGAKVAVMDGLAEAWTEDETLRAQFSVHRRADDIPESEFSLYETCLEETLQEPDEVWAEPMSETDEDSLSVFHFMRFYPNEGNGGAWYVVTAKETDDEEQLEIIDAFPTRDSDLVQKFRRGSQEVGSRDEAAAGTRLVH